METSPLAHPRTSASLTLIAAHLYLVALLAPGCRTSSSGPAGSSETALPAARSEGGLESVATFSETVPAGVAVSKTGRIFVAFPRWDDQPFTVAEIVDGRPVPYPSRAANDFDRDHPREKLGSVEALTVASGDLWVLDSGRPDFDARISGAAKLLRIDLESDRILRRWVVPERVVRKWSYLAGLVVAPQIGKEGTAFVTDASEVGLNGLITIDLASGRARRRLDRHPSTRATPDFVPFVERRPVYFDLKDAKPGHLTLGAHGVALSGDRQRLFYAPLASRRLYSVSVDALLDPSMPPWRVEDTLRRYGDLGFATDGMATGPDGALYLSNFEDGAIVRFRPGHVMESVVRDPRLLWPDSLAIRGGYLYVTVTQRHRQHVFNDGKDLAEPPYVLYRAPLPEYARP